MLLSHYRLVSVQYKANLHTTTHTYTYTPEQRLCQRLIPLQCYQRNRRPPGRSCTNYLRKGSRGINIYLIIAYYCLFLGLWAVVLQSYPSWLTGLSPAWGTAVPSQCTRSSPRTPPSTRGTEPTGMERAGTLLKCSHYSGLQSKKRVKKENVYLYNV